MSWLSGRLRSGGVRFKPETLIQEDCLELETPGNWGGEGGHTRATVGAPPSVDSFHYGFFASPSFANGLCSPEDILHKRPRFGARRRRQPEQVDEARRGDETQPQLVEAPKQCLELHHTQMELQMQKNMDSVTNDPGLLSPPACKTKSLEGVTPIEPGAPLYCPTNPQSPSKMDHDLQHCTGPVLEPIQLPTEAPSTPPVFGEGEKKYALRSSGQPRFPCRLRKSSRRRRTIDDEIRPEQREGNAQLERNWKTEGMSVKGGESFQASKVGLHADISTLPHRVMEITDMIKLPCQTTTLLSCRGRRRSRYMGIRKIVVKVARIPVSISRRQKSYKISSLEPPAPPVSQDGSKGNNCEGSEGVSAAESAGVAPREPTALLKMKNNGKSVMVMFPPGELPVILKRRRGRPPKQALPGQPDPREAKANAAASGEPKKPRRKRRVKLPSPLPSYVADTNDVKTEYGDVLSKLAFLNRQPPATGRCSPPRCWTPSEPESFHKPLENPGISTLLHRLTGFRRRGGRAGCLGGRGGGAAGSSEAFKSSFCDFFETIGKKRKGPLSEPGQSRKRGKGVAAGMSRAAAGTEGGSLPPGEKGVRKRRQRKNGVLKALKGQQEQEWTNSGSNWGSKGNDPEGINERERAAGYQGGSSPRGRFTSEKGGLYPNRAASGTSEEPQGLFAGYFRSLLDSDDSSDLLDISLSSPSTRSDSRKPAQGYDSSSPAQSQRWSPAFPKRAPKGQSPARDSPLPSQPCAQSRPAYNYNMSQTSPTTSFAKSLPSALSQSRSPSSTHPSVSGFNQYPSGYNSGQQAGGGNSGPIQQRLNDCSYPYGTSQSSSKTAPGSPANQFNMGYLSYPANQTAKRGFAGYPVPSQSGSLRGDSGPLTGPSSPGGNFMAMAKTGNFTSLSPSESCKPFTSQWGYRQGYQGWGGDTFGPHQYHGYGDYCITGNESKDILDISNYTPQKAKQRSFAETFSESSSDSSHIGPVSGNLGGGSGGYKQRDNPPAGETQSSLSSLEKLMLDWHENSAGPSYNWSQSVLFQSGSKPGRGRRKRAEPQGDSCPLSFPPASPSSSSSPGPGPKRSPVAARQPRGLRGRGTFSSCQRERAPPGKAKSHKPPMPTSQPSGAGLFQDTLDYYSGDSSSLSPLPSQQQGFSIDVCEYSSPYSVHPSTPSSDERFSQLFPGEAASLSPSLSLQSEPLRPYPKPAPPAAYSVPTRTFSPTCSPTPRHLSSCSAAQSPHRPPGKDFPQYDSPSYCGSPCWYGQGGSLASSPQSYESERQSAAALPPHGRTEKRDLSQVGGAGLRAGPAPHSPYPTTLQRGSSSSSCATVTMDSSPLPEDVAFSLHPDNYPPMSQRYAAQSSRGGMLCQLLDQPSDDGFTVTSL